MQLNKFIAHAGIASRRKAEELIRSGKVLVNSVITREPAVRVSPSDEVCVNGRVVHAERKVYVLLNKPAGYVTTVQDERGRRTVVDLVSQRYKQRIYPVGRLDRATTGLILLTNDGELAQALAHPRNQVEKVYIARLDKNVLPAHMALFAKGQRLIDGFIKPDAINFVGTSRSVVRIALHSGKNHIVRRYFAELGYTVVHLDRCQYAGMIKGALKQGMFRSLAAHEVELLRTFGTIAPEECSEGCSCEH